VQLNGDNRELVHKLNSITFDELNAVFHSVGLNPTPDALVSVLKDCKLTCPITLKDLVKVSALSTVTLRLYTTGRSKRDASADQTNG
jgi:hypothetical protein